MTKAPSSLYAASSHPTGTRILVSPRTSTRRRTNSHNHADSSASTASSSPLSTLDQILVTSSSLFVVGSVVWVPLLYTYLYKKWKSMTLPEQRKRRALLGALLTILLGTAIVGPHRSRKVGEAIKFRSWRLWKAWLRFVAFEVVKAAPPPCSSAGGSSFSCDSDVATAGSGASSSSSLSSSLSLQPPPRPFNVKTDPAILTFVPHGIVPFALGFAALADEASEAWGTFRPVAATATRLFPFVRTFLGWAHVVDASRSAVENALSTGSRRIGLAPGGIAEMFEGYPKPLTHPDDECALLQDRKGFVKMAIRHNVPVIPVYCFGATKMLKRIQLPGFEYISKLLRISICIFFGKWGLPVPFRQRLLYVMGEPIFPPSLEEVAAPLEAAAAAAAEQQRIDDMHKTFCDELRRIFDRHKGSYGWDRKTLRLV